LEERLFEKEKERARERKEEREREREKSGSLVLLVRGSPWKIS
jgi:hypothetical protein